MSTEELKSIFIPFSLHFNPHIHCYFARIKFLLALSDISKHIFHQPFCHGNQVKIRVGAGGVGAIWAVFQPYSAQTHLLKKIQVLLGVAEIFRNVKEAENLLLADVDPVLVFPCVGNATQKDPIGFPHCFLAHCNAVPLGVEEPLLPTQAQAYNMENFCMAYADTLT